jgi:hypothetical protein
VCLTNFLTLNLIPIEKFYVISDISGKVLYQTTGHSKTEVLKALIVLHGNTRFLTVLTEEEYCSEKELNALENEMNQ